MLTFNFMILCLRLMLKCKKGQEKQQREFLRGKRWSDEQRYLFVERVKTKNRIAYKTVKPHHHQVFVWCLVRFQVQELQIQIQYDRLEWCIWKKRVINISTQCHFYLPSHWIKIMPRNHKIKRYLLYTCRKKISTTLAVFLKFSYGRKLFNLKNNSFKVQKSDQYLETNTATDIEVKVCQNRHTNNFKDAKFYWNTLAYFRCIMTLEAGDKSIHIKPQSLKLLRKHNFINIPILFILSWFRGLRGRWSTEITAKQTATFWMNNTFASSESWTTTSLSCDAQEKYREQKYANIVVFSKMVVIFSYCWKTSKWWELPKMIMIRKG